MKLLSLIFMLVFSLSIQVAAQSNWLEAKPLPSWSERSRAILQTKKIAQTELARCRSVVRPASLPVDILLTRYNWTPVGDAQIFGKTTAVTVTDGFDGQCRPLGFQTFVFVGNRVAGTLSPGLMNSRSDGSLTNVKLLSETSLVADYVRYQETDALCCPSRINRVTFKIEPDRQNWLLKPDLITEAAYQMSVAKESATTAAALGKTVWRWQRSETANGETTTVDKPENYQLEFTDDGKARVQADCNRGNGGYTASGNNLRFTNIALTRRMCAPASLDGKFLRGLEFTRTFQIDANTLSIKDDGNNTMYFLRVSK